MATKIFPSVNDINGGVAGQGKTLTEANLKTVQALPYFDKPYVKSGSVCTNGGGLNLNVATGHYMIDGRWVYKDATESVLLTASSTNRVWLQLQKDGSGNVTGTTWNVQTGTTVPTDAVLVAEVITGASTITTIYTSYRGIIAPGKVLFNQSYTSGAGSLVTGNTIASRDIIGDGVTPMRPEFRARSVASTAPAGNNYGVLVQVAGTDVGSADYHSAGANFQDPCHAIGDPSQASMTFVGRKVLGAVVVVNGGTFSWSATATVPAWLRAVADF